MAGRGFAPKPADKRARRNAEPIATRVIERSTAAQPDLGPSPFLDDETGEGHDWHPRTVEWWGMWAASELTSDLSAADWQFLLDTAVIHSRFWYGDMKQAAELRLRVAKFGVTPEDRARLRIVFADATEKEERRSGIVSSPSAGTGTYGHLRAAPKTE